MHTRGGVGRTAVRATFVCSIPFYSGRAEREAGVCAPFCIAPVGVDGRVIVARFMDTMAQRKIVLVSGLLILASSHRVVRQNARST